MKARRFLKHRKLLWNLRIQRKKKKGEFTPENSFCMRVKVLKVLVSSTDLGMNEPFRSIIPPSGFIETLLLVVWLVDFNPSRKLSYFKLSFVFFFQKPHAYAYVLPIPLQPSDERKESVSHE